GTGLYIESLLYPVSHSGSAKPNQKLRERLEKFAEKNGNKALWNTLDAVDPLAAKKIHPNNVRRVIRALEVYEETGKRFSDFQHERKKQESLYDAYIVFLNTDRKLLYKKINSRVDEMLEGGLLEEVKQLWEKIGPTVKKQSAQGIGYKELFAYFNQ